eukprot:340959-Pyramimonas_sp.AAC.1
MGDGRRSGRAREIQGCPRVAVGPMVAEGRRHEGAAQPARRQAGGESGEESNDAGARHRKELGLI